MHAVPLGLEDFWVGVLVAVAEREDGIQAALERLSSEVSSVAEGRRAAAAIQLVL